MSQHSYLHLVLKKYNLNSGTRCNLVIWNTVLFQLKLFYFVLFLISVFSKKRTKWYKNNNNNDSGIFKQRLSKMFDKYMFHHNIRHIKCYKIRIYTWYILTSISSSIIRKKNHVNYSQLVVNSSLWAWKC